MFENGNDKIIGGGVSNILYLSGACHQVAEKLFPEHDRAEIEKILNWFYMKMRTETQRLIKLIVPGKVQGGKMVITSASQVISNKEEQINNIFAQNGSLLQVLDEKLKHKRFMASNDLTVADVIIYAEISTILSLLSEHHTSELARRFEHVSKWHDNLSEMDQIKKFDVHMKELIHTFDLKEKHTGH